MQDAQAAGGTFVQVIDVLGDERELRDVVCHGGDRAMGGVGLCVEDRRSPPFVPAPHQCGVAFEGVRRREFGGVKLFPKTGLFVAEGRDTALGGDAGAGEDGDAGRRA